MKASDIRRGTVVEHQGRAWQVREIERSSPQGRGGNVTFRFIMHAVPGGQKLDLSLRADDELPEVELQRRPVGFSYREGDTVVFMDSEDYSQYSLDVAVLGDMAGYLTDDIEGCMVQLIDGEAVGIQLPQTVVLEVVETAPELKGASATKRGKPATLSTGIEVTVPEYVTTGTRIIVNTVTGEFSSRA